MAGNMNMEAFVMELLSDTTGFEAMLAEKNLMDCAEDTFSVRKKERRKIARDERAVRHSRARKKAAYKNLRNRGNKPYKFRRSGYFWEQLERVQKSKLPISSIEDYFDDLEIEQLAKAKATARSMVEREQLRLIYASLRQVAIAEALSHLDAADSYFDKEDCRDKLFQELNEAAYYFNEADYYAGLLQNLDEFEE